MYVCMYMNFNITQEMVHNKSYLKIKLSSDKMPYVGVGMREGAGWAIPLIIRFVKIEVEG